MWSSRHVVAAFFYICEYFRITPQEFFDEGNQYLQELNALISDIKQLDAKTLSHISGIVKELVGRK